MNDQLVTWYVAEFPPYPRGFDRALLRLATQKEIVKYELNKRQPVSPQCHHRGTLLTSKTNGSQFLFTEDEEEGMLFIVNMVRSEVNFAEYRLKCALEMQEQFLAKKQEIEAEKAREEQYIIDCRGIDI